MATPMSESVQRSDNSCRSKDGETDEKAFETVHRFMDGLTASVVGTLAVFPLDVIKTRQQMTQPGEPSCGQIHRCGYKILKREGIRGLYRGATIVAVMTTPERAVKQVCNDYLRTLLPKWQENNKQIRLLEEVGFGMLTGFVPVIISAPTDAIKMQLQDAGRLGKPKVCSTRLESPCQKKKRKKKKRWWPRRDREDERRDREEEPEEEEDDDDDDDEDDDRDDDEKEKSKRQTKRKPLKPVTNGHTEESNKYTMSSWGVLRQTLSTYGVNGLYVGGTVTTLREMLFSAGYFPLMENIRSSGIFGPLPKLEDEERAEASATFLSGFLAASLMAWLTTPFEVLSTRLQMSLSQKTESSGVESSAPKVADTSVERIPTDLETPLTFEADKDHKYTVEPRKVPVKVPAVPGRPDDVKYGKSPIPQKYRDRLKKKQLGFIIPCDKPIRKYCPTNQAIIKTGLLKDAGKVSEILPSSPSPIYYDANQVRAENRYFEPTPSVGRAPLKFVASPSVGSDEKVFIKLVRKQRRTAYRSTIIPQTGAGWTHSEAPAPKKVVVVAPPKDKFVMARTVHRVVFSQGVKAMFRGALCRVAVVAPRLAIVQVLYSEQIFSRFFDGD